jgi:hypothetical protein
MRCFVLRIDAVEVLCFACPNTIYPRALCFAALSLFSQSEAEMLEMLVICIIIHCKPSLVYCF